jgi:hypothetical protein
LCVQLALLASIQALLERQAGTRVSHVMLARCHLRAGNTSDFAIFLCYLDLQRLVIRHHLEKY